MTPTIPDDGMGVRQIATLGPYWFVYTREDERLAMFRTREDAELFLAAKRAKDEGGNP